MLYYLLINIKMPTTVGILTFMSRKNFILSYVEHGNSFITSGPGVMDQFHCSVSLLLVLLFWICIILNIMDQFDTENDLLSFVGHDEMHILVQ